MIDSSEFKAWKESQVTQEIFKALQYIKDENQKAMSSSDVIMHSDSSKILARLLGQQQAIDMILQIKLDDVIEEALHEN